MAHRKAVNALYEGYVRPRADGGIHTAEASDAYRDGWERTFGEQKRRRERALRDLEAKYAETVADGVQDSTQFLRRKP